MDYHFTNQESSSGCESGWTLYLDHSSISQSNQEHDYLDENRNRPLSKKRSVKTEQDETEDEDLSMVSDASSGPPHFHEEEEEGYFGNDINGNFYNNPVNDESRNRRKTKENRRSKVKDQSSLLDDTASSPLFDYSNNNCTLMRKQPKRENLMEEYSSQGYSTTQFDVRPPYQEHYGYFQSSVSGNQQQQNQWFEGKRW